MQKIKRIISIMLIVLLGIMIIPKPSIADVGSFESYDSGSDWGSSSDWSSSSSWDDDDWGSSSSGNYSDESNLDGFTIGIIIIVIIIVAIIGKNKRWEYAYKTITSSTEHGICRTSNK